MKKMADKTFVDTVYDTITGGDPDLRAGADAVSNAVSYVKGISKRETIRSKANGTICEYPMLVSTAISTETSSIITKAFEHEYMNLLILALTNTIEAEARTGESVSDILKRFHTPLSSAFFLEGCKEVNDKYSNEENNCYLTEDVNIALEEDFDFAKNYEEMYILSLRKGNERTLNEMSVPYDILSEATSSSSEENEEDTTKRYFIEQERLDAKKVNALAPTVIKITLKFAIKDRNGKINNTVDKEMRVGVKGYIHELKSTDIILNVAKNMDDANWLLRLIKWRMGEKKFFRDIVFEVDRQKEEAKNNAMRKKSPIWSILRRLSKKNKTKNILNIKLEKYPMVATTTLLITVNEVENIKQLSETGIDLLHNFKDVERLLDVLFLLTFAVVDESSNLVYIYNENSRTFETHTLNSLRAFGKEEIDMNNLKSLLK